MSGTFGKGSPALNRGARDARLVGRSDPRSGPRSSWRSNHDWSIQQESSPQATAPQGGPMRSPTSRPRRVSLRSRARGSSIHTVMRRIQERDIRIFFDLMEHRVLTTGQIVELHFSSYRIGSRRARLLHEMGFLARFRPSKSAGSAPWHYALDEPGAFVVATRLDRDLKDTPFRRQDVDRIAASEHLEHLVQTNGFFTRLAWACRQNGQATLREWRGERRSRRGWGVRVQPDGVGRVSSSQGEAWFFFELDRGTESHERLRAKLRRYAEVASLPGVPQMVLFAFPSERREAEARRSLFSPDLTIVTTSLPQALADPLGLVWQPLGSPFRVGLFELRREASKEDQVGQTAL